MKKLLFLTLFNLYKSEYYP